MISRLSTPYVLTDMGFSFILHDPALESFSACWNRFFTNPLHWHGELAFAIDSSQSIYLLHFSGLLTILVSLDTKTVNLWPEVTLSQEALKHILIDQLVPRILAARGSLVLHAGAVNIDGKAIALMGETGTGKSTLAASLHLNGSPLVNDDAVVIFTKGDQFFASASHPGLRLLPDSLVQLFATMPESKPVSEFTNKRHIVMSDGKRHKKPDFPLAALFFIGNTSVQQVTMREMYPAESVMAIITNSFALNPTEPGFAVANLHRASALAEQVPAFELNYPRNYEILTSVHQAIFNKLKELQA